MNARQRILAAIRGEPVDRTPWCPFLAYWWENQPRTLTDQGMLAFMRSIGADPMLRGMAAAWKMEQDGVGVRDRTSGGRREVAFETPVGVLRETYTYSPGGDTWFLTGHAVRGREDAKVLAWIYEHRRAVSDERELDRQLAEVGDKGLLVPILGAECKTSFQSLVERWIGTEQLCYLLADEPEVIENLLGAMRPVSRQTVALSAQSSGEAFIFWEDSSTTNISPSMFEQYTAPEIADWGEQLHRAGKLLIHHACGHLKALLPAIGRLPIDALESVSPPPTGNATISQARAALPGHIALIGGIEPVFFETCTMARLQAEVEALLASQAGRRYVLANSDSCPPGVSLDKLRAVAQWV